MLNMAVFALGWLLYLLAQMQNSIRSSSNNLSQDLAGMRAWLRLQWLNIVTRMFFSAVFYAALINLALTKLDAPLSAAGVHLASWGIAGVAGYSANAALHQLFGLIPFLRVEVPELAPASTSQSTGGGTP